MSKLDELIEEWGAYYERHKAIGKPSHALPFEIWLEYKKKLSFPELRKLDKDESL